jgi:hypothetical protein
VGRFKSPEIPEIRKNQILIRDKSNPLEGADLKGICIFPFGGFDFSSQKACESGLFAFLLPCSI